MMYSKEIGIAPASWISGAMTWEGRKDGKGIKIGKLR